MRITKWLGLATNASPYALNPGVNVSQVNLQNVIPGQLTPRKGMELVASGLVPNNPTGEAGIILSLHRQAKGPQSIDGLIALVAGTVRDLSNNTTLLAGSFTQDRPLSICEDRHGNIYVFQGHGVRPKRWGGAAMVDMGMPAPDTSPAITRAQGEGGFYIERVDVIDGGGAYWAPPRITVAGTLGANGRPASLRAVVEAGEVASVEVLDPGHNYQGPVTLSFDAGTVATNTFAASVTLATSTTPGQYGVSNSSSATPTGSLTADHTIATSQNNASIRHQVANTVNDQTINATFTSGIWTAQNVPLYRTSDNSDSGARVTLSFNNTPFTFTSGFVYGLGAFASQSNPANYEQAGYSFCEPPDIWTTGHNYPSVTVPGSGTYYRMRYDSATARFYADITVTGGTGTVRIWLAANPASYTVSTRSHPDLPAGTNWALPNRIVDRTILSAGSGYSSANASVGINYYIANTDTVHSTGSLSFTTTVVSSTTTTVDMPGTFSGGFAVTNPGSGWSSTDSGYVQLRSRTKANNSTPSANYTNAQKITFSLIQTTAASTEITGAVASVNVTNGAANLLTAPEILWRGGGGYGLELLATVQNGSIPLGSDSVVVVDGGAGFTSPPSLYIQVGGAEAAAVMRPTMQGTYQCAYRWVDTSVPEEKGGPIYSNFSPIASFNAGPDIGYRSTNELLWNVTATTIPSRATIVELWRTSSEQSLVFYRIAGLNKQNGTLPNGTDTFSDEQLFDPDRTFYQALPVVLPNGELNAFRFGQPRDDMAVCIAFQDRLWYGVSTSGEKINSLFFSEYDEFESCPAINEIPIQQNVKDPDYLTALIPFGASLLAMQTAHCYALTYVSDPNIDANVQLVGFRGCLNQNCWDIFEGTLYVMDERGIYAMRASGEIESLSGAISDIFRAGLLRGQGDKWMHLKIDPATKILRLFCTLSGEGSSLYHSTALCHHIESKTWWIEKYPAPITASASLKDSGNTVAPVYAIEVEGQGKIVRLDSGYTDIASNSIRSITVTNGGSGYRSPPRVSVPNGTGADLQAVLDSNGSVSEVVVRHGGTGYTNGAAVTFTGDGSGASANVATTSPTTKNRSITWSLRTGNMELPTDREEPRGGNFKSRAVAVTYKPTLDDRRMHLRLYYNNATNPRSNVSPRDRGTGFIHGASSTALNMKSGRSELAPATGVARALFAGRAMDDLAGTDRHVAIELTSDPPSVLASDTQGNAAVIYDVDIQGVVD